MPSRALNHKRVGKTFPRHRVTRGARTRGSQQQCDRTPGRNGGGLWRPPGPPRPTSTLEAPASNRGVGLSRTRAAKAKGTPRGRRPAAPRANASRRPTPPHTHTRLKEGGGTGPWRAIAPAGGSGYPQGRQPGRYLPGAVGLLTEAAGTAGVSHLTRQALPPETRERRGAPQAPEVPARLTDRKCLPASEHRKWLQGSGRRKCPLTPSGLRKPLSTWSLRAGLFYTGNLWHTKPEGGRIDMAGTPRELSRSSGNSSGGEDNERHCSRPPL